LDFDVVLDDGAGGADGCCLFIFNNPQIIIY
jgi:hypothetical protein